MTSKVVYTGNLRTEATHLRSGNTIITDAPVDNHGKGEAFSPTDLAATSLADCLLTVMGIYAAGRNIDLTGSTAEVTKIMAENPRRIAEIVVNVFINNANIPDKERKQLEHIGYNCPVSKSLHPDLKQTISFSYPQ